MNSKLALACKVFGKDCKECWCKGFLPLHFKLLEPTARKTMETIENQNKKYNQWILDDENGTFTPLVFTTSGGMITETKQFYKQISQLFCEKSDLRYSNKVRGLNSK